MLIDAYALLPWSPTDPNRPRSHLTATPWSAVLLVLILVFPVMVYSIEPVPSSRWALSIDPSYVSPSTSKNGDQVEYGSGFEETTTTVSSAQTSGYFAWYAGRKWTRKQNSSSVQTGDQKNQRRRLDRHRTEDVPDEHEEADSKYLTEPQPSAAVVRWYRLYNRCSGGYLQMYMNDVNARGKYASPLAQLRVVTDSYGSRIRIQSQKFGKYLCFNRRQRITSKYNGRSERCVFLERISDNHYTELESAWRPGLYLGFNRGDGKFLDPSRYYTDRRTCFQFIKNANVSDSSAFGAGFNEQEQNDGPADFSRLGPDGQRWLRERMRQENVDDMEEASEHRKRHHHRLRHERSRLRHHH